MAVWIASRAASRVLPLWWDDVLSEEWARERELTALPILRCILISSVAAKLPTGDIRAAAALAAAAAADDATTTASGYPAAHAAPAAAVAAADAATDAAADTSAPAYGVHGAPAAIAAAAAVAVGVLEAFREDAEFVASGESPDVLTLWSNGSGPLAEAWGRVKTQVADAPDSQDWQFWIDWYDALLDGRPMLGDAARTWEMLEKIALIDPKTWEKGPEGANPVIRGIWEGYQGAADAGSGQGADPQPVTDSAKTAMQQRVAVNRDALAVAGAGLMDQLGAFKESVRGMNHLTPEVRDEVLAFIDEFTGKLSALLAGLPEPGDTLADGQADRLVLWLREYRGLLRHKLAHYASAENMVEVTVPTGIILSATGIGAMMGMPVPGAIVGGLIVNQMKPGQAAKELTKSSGKDDDAG
ncbi:hypothetical protein [Roseovarius sp. MBR-78]|uniref:hypothetical protein n=1 Tax=Roseovarius sp. MBR-78 TaxID=3156460 RepID=UPI00339A7ED8